MYSNANKKAGLKKIFITSLQKWGSDSYTKTSGRTAQYVITHTPKTSQNKMYIGIFLILPNILGRSAEKRNSKSITLTCCFSIGTELPTHGPQNIYNVISKSITFGRYAREKELQILLNLRTQNLFFSLYRV